MSEPGFSGLKDLQDFSLLTMYSLKVLSRKPPHPDNRNRRNKNFLCALEK